MDVRSHPQSHTEGRRTNLGVDLAPDVEAGGEALGRALPKRAEVHYLIHMYVMKEKDEDQGWGLPLGTGI